MEGSGIMSGQSVLEHVQPGSVVTSPVKKNGEILFPEGHQLSRQDIVWLKLWRIKNLNVDHKSSNDADRPITA